MKVIICEKPNLAKNVAEALGVRKRANGYFEGNDYNVTWCFGHLLELKDANEYGQFKFSKWSDITSPIIPNPFEYKVKDDEGVKKQLKIIKQLISNKNVDEVINCGDADREGQLIVDNVIDYCKYKGNVKRLWLPEQTPETIRKEISIMKDNKDYYRLHEEGLARTYMDWLFGINLTVFLTNKTGVLMRAGRVLIPIVKFIYDRDMAIRNFIPKKYLILENTKNIKLTYKKKFDLDNKFEAEDLVKIFNSKKAKVASVEEKIQKKSPKKLFSLSTLQSYLSKTYGINFKTSLQTIQALYEQGYLTYPRTSTEYLAEEEKEKVKKLLEKLGKTYTDLAFKNSKNIFDSTKVESHSAITITVKTPEIEKLSDLEKKVYTTVLNRFLSNFTKEEALLLVKEMIIKVGDYEFKTKGTSIKTLGFLKYEPEKIENEMPNFHEGEEFDVDFKIIEKVTAAPPKVTESSLSNFLKNPFKKIKEDTETDEVDEETIDDTEEYKEMLKGVEIGTEATRTGIIENAKKIGYIVQNKKTLEITDLGIKFIETLNKVGINLYAEKTVEFSKILKQVYKNENSISHIVDLTNTELNDIFNKDVKIEKLKEDNKGEPLGICPLCKKGQIFQKTSKEGKVYYSCSENNCKFFLWENSKFFSNQIKVTKEKLKNMLNGKKELFKLKSKAGKDYEGFLKIKINGNFINFELDGFKNNKK
ncbi:MULTISPECIES: DNA topoisomerase [unclassified Fusobacterium]|uniref:DNA topoisomerase n=1 Tax=unclassified Fusobacterium TaxID=2648384 RepID=UPI001B8C07D6|nr:MULTISPECIES: DNA topoisomerase [unclassified Fusobacterium]MBR8701039.1 DNA topoisomerase 3 [Fusobacterium sp. DD45]MBR8710811.1 DNA topoisomerase 3 [Fusobacterium sp. DD28]MBR8751411.1 DNA topoisomerase 3 [Fusobacterium sp. DD26]